MQGLRIAIFVGRLHGTSRTRLEEHIREDCHIFLRASEKRVEWLSLMIHVLSELNAVEYACFVWTLIPCAKAYNDAHHYRAENPLAHLHEDEAVVRMI